MTRTKQSPKDGRTKRLNKWHTTVLCNWKIWIVKSYNGKGTKTLSSQIQSMPHLCLHLFSALMIAMAQAITKIILTISLTRMKLMVQDTQIVGKQLLPTDQNMNINHFRGLPKATFCFLIAWRVSIHPFFNSNYWTKKKSSIQSIREFNILFISLVITNFLGRVFGRQTYHQWYASRCFVVLRGFHQKFRDKPQFSSWKLMTCLLNWFIKREEREKKSELSSWNLVRKFKTFMVSLDRPY